MTSSSETAPAPAPAIEVVRHRLAAGARAHDVRAPGPLRVIERGPPPPPPLDVAPLARAVAAGIERVRAEVDAAFGALERECVELALAAAERVVRGRVERGELAFEEPLRALFAARRREIGELPAKLRVHPDDLERIAPKAAELAPPGARVELVADAALPRGDLALELGAARLVRSLDHELARLRERLLAGGDA